MSIISSTNTDLRNESHISSSRGISKKKKKRRRETEPEADLLDKELKEKKKRKRGHHTVQVQAVEFTSTKEKELEKRKDKGKQPESDQSVVHHDVDPNLALSSDSTAALISAIVAAATGTSDPALSEHTLLESNFQPQIAPHLSQQQFIPYPFAPYSHDTLPYMQQHLMQLPTFPPAPMGVPFSELTFGSNEDVLRALQALDMSKITTVLKSLGEAAIERPSAVLQSPATPLGQIPVTSGAILGPPSEQSTSSEHRRTLDMTLPSSEHNTNPDHAYLLANKWLNASKLAELVKTEGLVYKKGKFSAIEEQQLRVAINNYQTLKSLADDQLLELIFPKVEKNRDNAFWSEITAALPQRPIIAVYHHVRRAYHPMKQQGRWMPEEDAMLKQAVTDLGQQWEKVSQRVGRMSSDCRDRYRNHIIDRDVRLTGPWTKQEEEELTRIVTDMTVKRGKDIDNDVFWGRVSELMGGKRGRQQCRIKWTDALSKTIKNEGQKPRWSQQDAYILVHKVDSLNVRDDTEIDWKTISDPQWNLWSAHTLQRRWLTMKRGIKGYEDMTHQEIMDILRVKKAQLPPPVIPRKRKGRKVTSAAAVVEDPINNTGVNSGNVTGTVVNARTPETGSDENTTDSD